MANADEANEVQQNAVSRLEPFLWVGKYVGKILNRGNTYCFRPAIPCYNEIQTVNNNNPGLCNIFP